MRVVLIASLLFLGLVDSKLWPKGVVHYAINPADYDLNSQDTITTTFRAIEREICVKFFPTASITSTRSDPESKVLYITNPKKKLACSDGSSINGDGNIVEVAIGYKCMKKEEIVRLVVSMLRASINAADPPASSNDLVNKFHKKENDPTSLLSADDRNYINTYYYAECGSLTARPSMPALREGEDYSADGGLSPKNKAYYANLTWTMGIVYYDVDNATLMKTQAWRELLNAFALVEHSTCITFQRYIFKRPLIHSCLNFSSHGDDIAPIGAVNNFQGNSLDLEAFVYNSDPGYTSHLLNKVMRALGVDMMSNRFDRDNYVTVDWKNLRPGREYLMEKSSEDAWVKSIPYDYSSVTHAPTNYECTDACNLGDTTLRPLMDNNWQKAYTMGHQNRPSPSDVKLLKLIYAKQCQMRDPSAVPE